MATDITKNEISDFTPSWLDVNFPNDEEYISVIQTSHLNKCLNTLINQ